MTTTDSNDPQRPPAVPGVTFLHSTTTTIVDREPDGDTLTRVKHRAHFGVVPGTIADTTHKYGKQVFRPSWLEATWFDGHLGYVRITGPRVLTDGKVQKDKTGHTDVSRDYEWGYSSNRSTTFDHDVRTIPLPDVVTAALARYTYDVSLHVTEGNG